MSSLRRKLDDLKLSPTAPAVSHAYRGGAHVAALNELIGGSEECCGLRRFWRVVVEFGRVRQYGPTKRRGVDKLPEPSFSRADLGDIDPARALVLDIETGGFSGTPVFLIGVVALDTRPLAVEQWLARDYPEEEAILRRLAEWAATRTTWVTFNGKSFDAPFVLDRARVHGVRLTPPREHIDLLHGARRRWGGKLPDCRLTTLERLVLGRTRVGDVPGADVPDLFHHFIRTGNAAPLVPVLEHNQLDLITSTELLLHLVHG